VKSKSATIASIKNPNLLTKKEKSLQGDELLKEAFLTGANCFFEVFSNKCEIMSAVQDLQSSDNTVTRMIQVILSGMLTQLKSDWEMCDRFSLQFDESTGVGVASQLAFTVRMVFSDFTVKEELLEVLPMKRRTKGEDV
jgi:hypothetical protein